MDAGHVAEKDPRLSFLAWVQHVVQGGCERQDRGRRGPAVLRRDEHDECASVLPVCTICTSMSSGPRSMLKATVNVVPSLMLPCS